MTAITTEQVKEYLKSLQDQICKALEEQDGKAQFCEEHWSYEGGGGGRARVLEGGRVF